MQRGFKFGNFHYGKNSAAMIRGMSFLFGLLLCSRASLGVEIVVNQQPRATIVLPTNSLPIEDYTASQLQSHVQKATGALLPVVRESQVPAGGSNLIYLGATTAAQQAGVSVVGLKPNAFVSRVVGANLYFRGVDGDGNPLLDDTLSGTRAAVYDFLDSELGVRWLSPGEVVGAYVPQRAGDLVVNNLNKTVSPAFEYTLFRGFFDDQATWQRRQGFQRVTSYDAGHYYAAHQYWERFGQNSPTVESRPEYFALLPDGTRRPDPLNSGGNPLYVSMGLSDSGLQNQRIQDWLAERTAFAPHVDASDNDAAGRDLTPAALAWDVRDPSFTDSQWNNRVALATQAYNNGDANWPRFLGQLSDRYARYYLDLLAQAKVHDPNAKVVGLAYVNYTNAPLNTQLNSDVVIKYVAPLTYPWTDAKRENVIQQFKGWADTGAKMILRPNYMLDGHNFPIFFADKFVADFNAMYAKNNPNGTKALIGADYDSLTGQWATQGLNLYALARMNTRPGTSYKKIADEYYSAFGAAKNPVTQYFEHWRAVSNAVSPTIFETPEAFSRDPVEPGHWSEFYRVADLIFTPTVMATGWSHLREAALLAKTDGTLVQQRVALLEKGLTDASITLGVENAARAYRANPSYMNRELYRTTLKALDQYRASIEQDLVADHAYLRWAEDRSWDRSLAVGGTDFTQPQQLASSHGIGLGAASNAAGRSSLGQSFVPFLPLLTGISIDLESAQIADSAATLTLSLFQAGGGPDGHAPVGNALGLSTRSVQSLSLDGLSDFLFDNPILVAPGSRYFFKLSLNTNSTTDNILLAQLATSDGYGPGANLVFENNSWGYHDGASLRDLKFRVAQLSLTDYAASVVTVAEPTSQCLISVAVLVLLFQHRWRQPR